MSVPRHRSTVLTLVLAVLLSGFATAWPLAEPASAARYTPPAGVKVNNPLAGRAQRRAILDHLVRTIDAVPIRGQIKIASWNIRSSAVVDALVRAHANRKVGVRVVVDRLNANPSNPNRGVDRLQRELRVHSNKSRRPAQRSGVRRCRSACRGPAGIAHSKFFLFSKAGNARQVVINSSANATDLAASHQWNDAYTVRGQRKVYLAFRTVFGEMYRDRNVSQGFRTTRAGSLQALFYPHRGRHTRRDPVMQVLDRVRCQGARNTRSGRTVIRIGMTAWHGERGKKLAWKVRRLKNDGCDVVIVYAVAGNEVLRILRREGRRPVPMRQIVQDFDHDGVYDRYLHTKVLTIKGHLGRNRRATLTVNGSENWTPVALVSDEAILRLSRPGVLRRYNNHIEWLFANPPRRSRMVASGRSGAPGETRETLPEHLPLGATVEGVDPYAALQEQ